VCLSVDLPSFLGNNSAKTFSRERRIIRGVVFNAVRVISKESRQSVVPRTFCYIHRWISRQLDVIGLINHLYQQNVIV
jgi:hypothetical protein